ncbi:MazG family protein [Actinokineospora sp. 24-640]
MTDSAVVLVRGRTVPESAVPLLRTAARVEVAGDVDPALAAPGPLDGSVVLLTDDLADPAALALLAEGVPLHAAPGAALVAATQVMDRLRSPGGCPWDAEQTHESLRQYLIEECYELLEAIEDGDRAALREELGDVLLQVLFHARVAEEHPTDPFTVDDVAAVLITKLVGRHPHVFGAGDPSVRDASSQERRWEELKQSEKRRESCVDGVALGQPALALTAKLAQRTARAGLPADLLPSGGTPGARLFDTAALAKLAGQDPEGELRAVARAFAADVRAAETSARAAGLDPLAMDPDDWHAHWPR